MLVYTLTSILFSSTEISVIIVWVAPFRRRLPLSWSWESCMIDNSLMLQHASAWLVDDDWLHQQYANSTTWLLQTGLLAAMNWVVPFHHRSAHSWVLSSCMSNSQSHHTYTQIHTLTSVLKQRDEDGDNNDLFHNCTKTSTCPHCVAQHIAFWTTINWVALFLHRLAL